jgi:WD40 repeat protein
MGRSAVRCITMLPFLLGVAASTAAQPDEQAMRKARAATALIAENADTGALLGTAVCVDADGLFVTSCPAIRPRLDANASQSTIVTLVLGTDQKSPRKVKAKIIIATRYDDDEPHLALLKVEREGAPAPMEVADEEKLQETRKLSALAYPLTQEGRAALTAGVYPKFAVVTGRITTLARIGGKLSEIRWDARFPAEGSRSNGPVLDGDGKLVGIIRAGEGSAAARRNDPQGGRMGQVIPIRRALSLLKPAAKGTGAMVKQAPGNSSVPAAAPSPNPAGGQIRVEYVTDPEGLVDVEGVLDWRAGSRAAGSSIRPPSLPDSSAAYVSRRPVAAASDPLKQPMIVQAPGIIRDVIVGGGGRFLLLPLKGTKHLAVFDVNSAAIVTTVRLPSDRALVAAGAEKFVVVDPETKVIERWDLGKLEREKELALPIRGVVKSIALGSDSAGPMLACWTAKSDNAAFQPNFSLIDLGTLKVLGVETFLRMKVGQLRGTRVPYTNPPKSTRSLVTKVTRSRRGIIRESYVLETKPTPIPRDKQHVGLGALELCMGSGGGRIPDVRASADGRLFGFRKIDESGEGWETVFLEGKAVRSFSLSSIRELFPDRPGVSPRPGTAGYVVPDASGRILFTGAGSFDEEAQPISRGPLIKYACMPSQDPACCFALCAVAPGDNPEEVKAQGKPATEGSLSLLIHLGLNADYAFAVNGLSEMDSPGEIDFRIDKRFHLIPTAKLLITVPSSNDRLVLRRVDLDEARRRFGADLYVASPSVVRAAVGKELIHKLEVVSAKGGVTFTAIRRPAGSSLTADGTLRWRVPPERGEGSEDVVIRIGDASGREIYHAPRILIRNEEKPSPPPFVGRPMGPDADTLLVDMGGVLDQAPVAVGAGRSINSPRLPVKEGTFVLPLGMLRRHGLNLEDFRVDALASDGRVALSFADQRILVRDAATGKEVRRFERGPGPVNVVALAPDGRLAISGGTAAAGASVVALWDFAGGKVVRKLEGGPTRIDRLAFSADGHRALASGGSVVVWDVASGKRVGMLPGPFRVAALSPDGRQLLTADDVGSRLWDVEHSQDLRHEPPAPGSDGPVADVSFTRDGRQGLACTPHAARLWDLETGREVRRLAINAEGLAIAAPDGRRVLAVSREGDLHLWDVASRDDLFCVPEPVKAHGAAFSPDGGRVMLAGKSTLWLWQMPDAGSHRPDSAIGRGQLGNEMTKIVKVPGTIRNSVVGGGGRYLLLQLWDRRELAVFDVNAGDLVGTVPLPADDALIAAGAEKLLIVEPVLKTIQRWDLATRQREAEAPLPIRGWVLDMALGSDSRGPLLAAVEPDKIGPMPDSPFLSLIDIGTLKVSKIPVSIGKRNPDWPTREQGRGRIDVIGYEPAFRIRASADGRLFTTEFPITNLRLDGGTVCTSQLREAAIPGRDGTVLYTSKGLFDAEGNPDTRHSRPQRSPNIHDRVNPRTGQLRDEMLYYLPSTDRNIFLRLSGISRRDDDEPRAEVYLRGRPKPILELTDLKEMDAVVEFCLQGSNAHAIKDPILSRKLLNLDKRVHLIPEAALLVTIPMPNDRIVLRRLDVLGELNRRGIDYLYVASSPAAIATRGQAFAFALDVRTREGGVKYELTEGPPGLSVSPAGAIAWNVPAAFEADRARVAITVRDSTGQTVDHSLTIYVPGDGGRPASPAR